MIIAAGVLMLALGPLAHLAFTALGALVVLYGVWGWALEPTE
jgi:hypothetical protein